MHVLCVSCRLFFMDKKDVYILAIESSCDDTSAAVMRGNTVLSNVTAGQAVHEQYGGVVPELASRAHLFIHFSSYFFTLPIRYDLNLFTLFHYSRLSTFCLLQ